MSQPIEEKAATLLRAEKLVKAFGGRRVVNEVSVEIKKGEIIGLLGPNGAGKSTTFYMIVGRILPDSGCVWLGDTQLSDQPMYQATCRRRLLYSEASPCARTWTSSLRNQASRATCGEIRSPVCSKNMASAILKIPKRSPFRAASAAGSR